MNLCKKCNAPINEDMSYCEKCQDQMLNDAMILHMQASMKGDLLTMNRIAADYPNVKMSSTVMSTSDGGTVRVCNKCGYRNKGNFKFFETYTCSQCGSKL